MIGKKSNRGTLVYFYTSHSKTKSTTIIINYLTDLYHYINDRLKPFMLP